MASPTIKKILVPLDGSSLSEGIVPYAAGLAAATEASLVLFKALEGDETSEQAEEHLEEIAAELRKSGMGVATDSDSGDPATEIVEAARRYEVDLILMTGHASIQGRKDLLGSTAHSVLRRCTMPVLVLPLNAKAYAHPSAVIVGHDGSENANSALAPAAALARALSCELVLVRAVDAVSGLGGAARYYSAVDDFAEDDLEQLRDELAGGDLKVSIHVGKRPPDAELLGVAGSKPASVIAVSTTSLGDTPNALGSTTDRLVRSQTHPVLAVPEG